MAAFERLLKVLNKPNKVYAFLASEYQTLRFKWVYFAVCVVGLVY